MSVFIPPSLTEWHFSKPHQFVRIVGKCIYCSDPRPEGLTKEHVVASGLGGYHQLRAGTCLCCQRIINTQIETPFLQMSRDLRFAKKIGSRDLRQRPDKAPAWVHPTANADTHPTPPIFNPLVTMPGWERRDVPFEERPICMALFRYNVPGFVRAAGPLDSRVGHILSVWEFREEPQQPSNLPMYIETELDSDVLLRLVAKTAHAAGVWAYGIDGFEPYLTDIILGKSLGRLAFYVGGTPYKMFYREFKPGSQYAFAAATASIGGGSEVYLLAAVKIFAQQDAPEYMAVVGRLRAPRTKLVYPH
jgi:hypothetical protein